MSESQSQLRERQTSVNSENERKCRGKLFFPERDDDWKNLSRELSLFEEKSSAESFSVKRFSFVSFLLHLQTILFIQIPSSCYSATKTKCHVYKFPSHFTTLTLVLGKVLLYAFLWFIIRRIIQLHKNIKIDKETGA